MSNARVTFDLRRGTILVEGPPDDLTRLFDAVRVAAPALKHISIVTSDTDVTAPPPHDIAEQRRGSDASSRAPTMRDFARKLPLENTYQRIAVLAYYAAKYDRKPSFTVKDMNDWFGLCGFKKPAQMAVAMSDARRRYGYVENKGRDQWTVATGGENLVLEFVEASGAES